MTILELLSRLRKSEVELQVDGDRLQINAPEGVLTPSLKAELIGRKEEILEFLKTIQDESQAPAAIPPYPRIGPLPLSYSQERLWFLEQLSPGNYTYNMPGAIRLKGALNLACLERALNEILARHEILRANFETLDDQPVQIIAPSKPLPLKIINLSQLKSDDQIIEAKRLTKEEARQPFDLNKDLLVRATLLKLNEEDHIFLLTIHHIVSDGWSRGIFTHEFVTLYQAFLEEKPNPLPPLPIQYTDFARWQREWLQGDTLESQLAYWRQQLGGDLPQLELLLDKPRPPVQSLRSARKFEELSVPLCQALKHLSQEENATLFMTLLAAFKLLLQRHTGLEDIIVGSPIAGRNRAEVENLIGFFINTLVLRTDLSGNSSFRELIQRVRKTAMEAYTHQDIPFEKLLIELHPERTLSHTPLFQVFFNMINLDYGLTEVPGVSLDVFDMPDIGSKFDLTLYIIEKDQAIDLNLVYNTDIFTPERINGLLTQYKYLLSQIVADPDKKLNHYSLVTPDAESILPNPLLPLDASWHGAVHSQASQNAIRFPDRIALTDRAGSWSYQELEQRTNQLAHYLLAHGLERQQVVAIYGYRSISLVWAILGILKAGGAFLILDPAYPIARQIGYLEVANPQGFIQLEEAGQLPDDLESWISGLGNCRISLPVESSADHDDVLQGYPPTYPDLPVGPDDLAYIAFTSGSTGKPKGVMGRHGPLSHFIPWQREVFNLTQDDRFSMLSGLSHDPLQRDIFTALWVGASVHIPDPDKIGAPGWLNEWMRQEQITFSHFTPAMAQLLSKSTSKENNSESQITTLRYAFFIGDKLTRHDVNQLGRLAPNVICINSYGTTETQRAVGYQLIDPKDLSQTNEDESSGKAVLPVGRGMQDVQLLVLNNAQKLSSTGELGEIYVRSPHLAKGYLGDDSLTQERFVTNPFTGEAGDRLYKSGDLGRYLPDGKVEFLGRKDKQVKIRGFRIELGEIETTLSKHPAVRQTVVTAWEADSGDKRLVAYVVPVNREGNQPTDLRDFMYKRLPAHMIPSSFVLLDAIPITPNGKIDHQKLPPPHQDQDDTNETRVNARDGTEETLMKIWEDLLQVRHIGIRESFFELGGHSLLAVHMFAQIKEQFDVNLPLATLFQEATIEHLANTINHKVKPPTWSPLIGIETQGNHPPLFCIHGITGDILWFRDLAHCLAPDYPFYGLQARGLDGTQSPFSRIEDMAEYYISELRLHQPKGPYYLGGASLGGTVALEIAQQLLKHGEEVALLAIFDHAPRNVEIDMDIRNVKNRLIMGRKIIKNFPYWLKDFLQLGPSRMFMRLRRKIRLAKRSQDQPGINDPRQTDAMDLIDFASELPSYRLELIKSHYNAMNAYVPQPYPGQVTLFRARSRPLLNPYDSEWSWQKLAPGRVYVINVPGSHEGMFKKPHVYQLAEKLKSCLG